MEIRVLNYYLAVAKEGSLTAASKILHITQPTLSRQLSALEEELGKKLFTRSNYKIQLTEAGILFQERAQNIVDMADKALSEFHTMESSQVKGDVYIGAGETDKISFITDIIKELQAEYPDITYHFHTGNLNNIMERLDSGLMDFGVVFQECNADKYHYRVFPSKDRWGVIMRKDSPLSEKDCFTPNDLKDKPLILSRQAKNNELANWFGKFADHLNIVSTYDLLYNASHLVKSGVGYAVGFDGIINTGKDSELCFRPLYPTLKTDIILLWKKHITFSRPAEILHERLISELNKTVSY